LSKKIKVIEYIEDKKCTVCTVSRKPLYTTVGYTGYFVGCETSNEKITGEYLTLILLKDNYYCEAVTYRITERWYFESFTEAVETMGAKTLGYELLSPKGFSSRMIRIYEPESKYKVSVFKLEKQPYPIYNDPPLTAESQKRIEEFEAEEKHREYTLRISQIPILSEDEQQCLEVRSASGDIEAKKRIVESYLQLVLETAKHYANSNSSVLDLIGVGNSALINAIDHLEKIPASQILCYMHQKIRESIMTESSNNRWRCNLPADNHLEMLIKRRKEFDAAQKDWLNKYRHAPSDEELAEKLSWSIDDVNDFLDYQDEASEGIKELIES
jgi:DNA-directed RNA polymerase sigma subunit (sigma70/sigma32)